MPEELGLTPARAVALAQDLIDAGRPFHAHEVLEAAWKSAPAGERDLWQGLAQLAVGLTHARRGNDRGAVTLLRRGAAAVGGYLATGSNPATDDNMPTGGNTPTDGYVPGRPHGIEVSGARAAANQLADQIERSGLESIPATDLRLQLAADLHPDQVP